MAAPQGTFVYGTDTAKPLALSFPAHEAKALEQVLFEEFDAGRGVRVTFHVIIGKASRYRTFYLTAATPLHFAYVGQDAATAEADPALVDRFRTAIADRRALHFPVERMPEETTAEAAE